MTRYQADLDGSEPGTALRARISAGVSDIRMPADLLDQAVRRNRKRTARNRLAGAAAAVAVAAVAATVVATVPGSPASRPISTRPVNKSAAIQPHHQRLQVQTDAYVVAHVATALADSYHMISVDRGSGGMDTGSINYTDLATQQQRYVSGLRDSAGEPYLQTTTSISHGIWTESDFDYADHAYSVLTASDMDHGQRVTVSSWLPLQSNPDPAVAFRQALKAGTITVVGHRTLDGRDTILLHASDKSADPMHPSSIWVDASTFMVVQTQHFIHAYKGGSFIAPTPTSQLMWIPLVDRVTWLDPTTQNLALLTMSPPAGFTEVPYSTMVTYLGRIS
jgi:hypothetical protein